MDEQLTNRARVAWIKRHRQTVAPTVQDVSVAMVDGLKYVILSGKEGTLAVYRVRKTDGILKFLRRWPKALRSPASDRPHRVKE
jgi:hypothetical protein